MLHSYSIFNIRETLLFDAMSIITSRNTYILSISVYHLGPRLRTRDNRTDSAPTCSKLWDPIIPKIACTRKTQTRRHILPQEEVILLF